MRSAKAPARIQLERECMHGDAAAAREYRELGHVE